MSGLSDRAIRAAEERDAPKVDGVPPQESVWRALESQATGDFIIVFGEQPGPFQRLEQGQKAWSAHAHSLPAQVRMRGRILRTFVDDLHELVWAQVDNKGKWFYVYRGHNPMEEPMLTPINSLADFGAAIR